MSDDRNDKKDKNDNGDDDSNNSNSTKTIEISVGKSGWSFDPEDVKADIGDVLSFKFFPPDHSVVRSTFQDPCIPYENIMKNDQSGGMWSGIKWVSNDNMTSVDPYIMTVKDTEPWFVYCGAPGSCNKRGMVMAINSNKTQTLADYRKRALKQPYSLMPGQSPPSENGEESGTVKPAQTPTQTSATSIPTVTIVANAGNNRGAGDGSGAGRGLGQGIIAAIVLGGVIGLALIILLGFLLYKRQQRKQDPPVVPQPQNDQFVKTAEEGKMFEYNTANSNMLSVYTSPGVSRGNTQPTSPVDASARNTIVLNVTEEEKVQMLQRLGVMRSDDTASEASELGGRRVYNQVYTPYRPRYELDGREPREAEEETLRQQEGINEHKEDGNTLRASQIDDKPN